LPKKAKTSSGRKKVRKVGGRSRIQGGQPINAAVELQAGRKLFDLKLPSRPYRRELKNPIVRASKLDLMLRGSPKEQDRLSRDEDSRLVEEQFRKLFLLFDHFGIPRTSHLRWFHLAFHLARQHVPGMKIVTGTNQRRGPKGKWRERRLDSELIVAVTAVERERGRGAADAIRILRKRVPNLWGRFEESSLRTRYYEALRPMKPFRRGNLIESLAAWLLPEGPPK
jgi:hypothetical protein